MQLVGNGQNEKSTTAAAAATTAANAYLKPGQLLLQLHHRWSFDVVRTPPQLRELFPGVAKQSKAKQIRAPGSRSAEKVTTNPTTERSCSSDIGHNKQQQRRDDDITSK